ncbi:phosphoribosyl-aminoimidazole-succinocarboxamide synthase [Histoplasma capsulatum var. duboisii H88]|uniref:Phosphoribosylaminoimidazole-succinocarboxamide synthase n=1 Tax=Ajellomyces capsulatus (strain H88) TaxID=544711 RepID=A0A8A1LLQ9_AJEC8|nr:phosphoribosyl-aminoimidazole-succinocarboxamide synthase [Histoplasma capsulatum var. duboisii H88]
MAEPMTTSNLQDILPLVARGKVRDLYEVDPQTLLFVATDRISAYDVIMANPVPNKGTLLTLLTTHWFKILTTAIPTLRTHFLTLDLPPQIPESLRPALQNRCMQVRKLKVFPIEAIVRGYITGSAWKEYQQSGTVHGMKMPEGLKESQRFPDGPIYTPSTKAEQGEHDENIHPDQAVTLLGPKYASIISSLALKLSAANYEVGKSQESFDKQFLRDWLVKSGLKGKDGVSMDEEVVRRTGEKYREAYEKITGDTYAV